MAVEFSLKLNGTVKLFTLLEDSQRVVKGILRLPEDVMIAATSKEGQSVVTDYAQVLLGKNESNIMFSIPRRGAAILTISKTRDQISERWATIDAGIFRSAVSFVLAIGIAIALGRSTRSMIVDDALILKVGRIVKPDPLLETLQLDKTYSSLDEAAFEFCKR